VSEKSFQPHLSLAEGKMTSFCLLLAKNLFDIVSGSIGIIIQCCGGA